MPEHAHTCTDIRTQIHTDKYVMIKTVGTSQYIEINSNKTKLLQMINLGKMKYF